MNKLLSFASSRSLFSTGTKIIFHYILYTAFFLFLSLSLAISSAFFSACCSKEMFFFLQNFSLVYFFYKLFCMHTCEGEECALITPEHNTLHPHFINEKILYSLFFLSFSLSPFFLLLLFLLFHHSFFTSL